MTQTVCHSSLGRVFEVCIIQLNTRIETVMIEMRANPCRSSYKALYETSVGSSRFLSDFGLSYFMT
jgi:hypothetical protein